MWYPKGYGSGQGWYAPAVIAATTTQWDSSDHSVDITVSSATVLVRAAGFSYEGARSLSSISHSTGKYYFEMKTDTVSSFYGFGIANASWPENNQIGSDANAVGYRAAGDVACNGSNIVTTTSYNNNEWCAMAVDLGAKLLWVHAPGMTNFWNNNASADPASGTGGLSFAAIAAGPYFIAVQTMGGETVTANFGASAYTYAGNVPAGFGNW